MAVEVSKWGQVVVSSLCSGHHENLAQTILGKKDNLLMHNIVIMTFLTGHMSDSGLIRLYYLSNIISKPHDGYIIVESPKYICCRMLLP